MDESVSEITAAIASGDAEAFARFYRAWFDRAYGYARRTTGRDESFCLDVVQDAMMRVIRSMRVMESEQELRNWMRAVVMSCAYDRLRREKRNRLREARIVSQAPHEQEDLSRRLAWLESKLENLDATAYPLIVLKFRFGWTLDRIGQALGIKSGAVDGGIRRAMKELRQKADEFHDE